MSYSIRIIQEKNSDLPFNFSEWGIVKDMQKHEDRSAYKVEEKPEP